MLNTKLPGKVKHSIKGFCRTKLLFEPNEQIALIVSFNLEFFIYEGLKKYLIEHFWKTNVEEHIIHQQSEPKVNAKLETPITNKFTEVQHDNYYLSHWPPINVFWPIVKTRLGSPINRRPFPMQLHQKTKSTDSAKMLYLLISDAIFLSFMIVLVEQPLGLSGFAKN